jgi:HD superfamily phosphohydrolase
MSLKSKIDKFVGLHLDGIQFYTEKRKYVHDPIWGTIELYPHECCVLDSPLLQRLRQIHQTGFVYATFPSASHTRFEHTIGVMHLAGKIASTLKERHPKDANEKTIQKVRLAALLHDTGHSAFSHTSEEIFESRKDLHDLLKTGGEFQGKGAGEVLSYLIATSQAFRKFFRKVRKQYPKVLVDVNDFAPLILGRADPEKRFEADIISGPVDADKLDYFPRDGRASGVELAVDIERLLHCLSIASERRAGKNYRLMVVSRGGFNAIQQLLFARATLFASVYHHHKVRACDCMVKACFEHFSEKGMKFKKNSVYPGFNLKSAADFLFLTDTDFFGEAYNHKCGSLTHQLIHDLVYRRLFKRVLTISRNTVRDFDNSQQKAGYSQFFNLRACPEAMRALAKKIADKAKFGGKYTKVWLDIPREPSFRKAGDSMVNMSSRTSNPRLMKLESVIPIAQWVDTYQQYYAQSFLFGPESVAERRALAISALKILEFEYGLKLNRDAIAEDLREFISEKIVPA